MAGVAAAAASTKALRRLASFAAARTRLISSPTSLFSHRQLPPLARLQPRGFTRSFASAPLPPPDGTSTSSVVAVKTDSEYLSALSLAQENQGLAVVYFTAKWCGPCRFISPVVDELSMKYDNVTFLKVDIDSEGLDEITSDSGITSVPTFKFYRDGKSISEIVGANATELKNRVAALCNK